MTIGERIKLYRTRKGWTQAELAYQAGISSACISWYETGRALPSILTLIGIADALDMSLDQLVGRGGL